MADGARVALWSAADGRLVATHELGEDAWVQSIAFTPDSRELLLMEGGSGRLARLSVDGLAVLQSATLDADVFGVRQLRLIGLAPDGATILAVGDQNGDGGAAVFGLDAETLQIVRSVPDAHLGSPKSFAISPDRSTFATGASDGKIKVWDSATGELLQQLSIGGRQVQGLAFVDDHTLAAVPREGGLLLMTIDPAELVAALRGSLTRGLTASECATYAIDPCPTLEKLRSEPATRLESGRAPKALARPGCKSGCRCHEVRARSAARSRGLGECPCWDCAVMTTGLASTAAPVPRRPAAVAPAGPAVR
jgi:sugar lactone lactonase YvrE